MGTRDPRVDRYIEKSAPFAQPILTHLRDVVHAACPEAEETLKWSMPFFTWHGNLCFMAAFKQHVGFGFWKGPQALGKELAPKDGAMGHLGPIGTVRDLPSKRALSAAIRHAMRLNTDGAGKAAPKKRGSPKPAPRAPADFAVALKASRKAAATWKDLSPGHRREYVEWITEAKRAETRERRIATSIEWLSAGKRRNWKYGG